MTWMEKYYPIAAHDCCEDKAIEHSLRKWKGLRVDTLAEFGLEEPPIEVDCDTCALCYHYLRPPTEGNECRNCPLCKTLGYACDRQNPKWNELTGPYVLYKMDGDPEPMIEALEKCLEKQNAS